MIALALILGSSLGLARPPQFKRTFSFWIGQERVGAVAVSFDGHQYRYASTTVIARGSHLEPKSFSCTTDAKGAGVTSDGVRLRGPLPSAAALWLFADGASGRCIDVEDERTGKPGRVCGSRRGDALEGTLQGEPFQATLGSDGGPTAIALPRQSARFAAETHELPLPRPRDLFASALPAGSLAALPARGHARVTADALACAIDATLDRTAPRRDVDLPRRHGDDPFAEVARDATRGLGGTWQASARLAKLVDQAIAPSPPDSDEHDPALTWKRRRGSCVGHAVVFLALARALGIHARIVYGALVEDGTVAAHAWNEVEVDGRFYGVDASRGQVPVGPEHIPLARSDDADPLRAGRCLLALPQMRWQVLDR